MKKSALYEIALKLFGVYLLISAISILNNILISLVLVVEFVSKTNTLNEYNPIPFLLLTILHFAITLAVAGLLLFKTKRIVQLICKPADDFELTTFTIDRQFIYELAFVIAGVFIILTTLPEFVFKLKDYFMEDRFSNTTVSNLDLIISTSIKLVLGLVALFYSKLIAKRLMGSSQQ